MVVYVLIIQIIHKSLLIKIQKFLKILEQKVLMRNIIVNFWKHDVIFL